MQATVVQAKSGVWLHIKHITGSKAGKLLQRKKSVSLLTDVMYPKPFTTSVTQWGELNELIMQSTGMTGESKREWSSVFVRPSKGFLAASPEDSTWNMSRRNNMASPTSNGF